jgi:predicted lipoprotein
MVFTKRNLGIGLLSLILVACGGNGSEPGPTDNAKDREAILAHWVDNIIIPSYSNFKTKFDVMASKATDFTSAPSQPSLAAFRSAWIDAYIEWQKVELFEFGPADRQTLRNFFNIYPADVAGINANIDNAAAALDVPSSYARQGFPALDYLINGVGVSDAAILTFYTDSPAGIARLNYITKLIARMNSLLTLVISDWNGVYRETFISKTGLDIGSSFGLVVNAYVLHFERYIRSGKIGIPSGATIASAGVPYPETVEAYYQHEISRQLATTANQAATDFFNGKNANTGEAGPSFASYLDALEAKDASTGTLLSAIINSQFATISSNLAALSASLYSQVQTNNQAMLDTYAAMQKQVRLLKVDMTSAMSITITYTDNDGD